MALLSQKYLSEYFITFPTEAEFLYGLRNKSERSRHKEMVFLSQFPVLHTTQRTAKIMAIFKDKYSHKGKVFSFADLLIATLVYENDMSLVTYDKSFQQIKELNLEVI